LFAEVCDFGNRYEGPSLKIKYRILHFIARFSLSSQVFSSDVSQRQS